MRKIAHIINPFTAAPSSDLYSAQIITFKTMSLARQMALDTVDVELVYTKHTTDFIELPDDFSRAPDLNRTIIDNFTFKEIRRLPLIKDILDRLYYSSDAEYFIYTNVDIAVMPFFYITVNKYIDKGLDAFVINRRTIPEKYTKPAELPLMFSEIGKQHPGQDCFVFKKEYYPDYKLGTTCIGANFIGKVLIFNLIRYANNFMHFKDLHLTFHIGDRQTWKDNKYIDYDQHNERNLIKLLETISDSNQFVNYPLVKRFIDRFNIEVLGTKK